MLITEEDHRVVVGKQVLKVTSQTSAENRVNTKLEAWEEISGHLCPKYGCGTVFSVEDDGRNRLVVMYTCDIALYHMSASQLQEMGAEIREKCYKRATEWLEDVQVGKIIPDLPLAVDEDGGPTGGIFIRNSQLPLRHNWQRHGYEEFFQRTVSAEAVGCAVYAVR